MPFLYRLESGHTLSIKQLRQTLQLIVIKHLSLRTSLIFDTDKNLLIQRIIDLNEGSKQLFTFIQSTFETNEQFTDIMHNEKRNSQLFNLAEGLVFRCHLVYYKQISANDLFCDKDAIIFNFHHALFDFPSMDVFLHDLNQAYTTDQLPTNNGNALRYLDCKYEYLFNFSHITYCLSFFLDAIVEQQMPMTAASMFWLDALHDCNLDRSLPLPYDRYRLVDEHRTGRGTTISFDFGPGLSHEFLAYASSNNISIEHLALACYYAFLFKLTNGERDLCIGMNTNGRYKEELKSVIGMFVNAIPLRCQIDSHWSFHQLVENVRDMITSNLKYSYFPLQRILAQHPNVSKPTFLDTSFGYCSSIDDHSKSEVIIGDSQLYPMPMSIQISGDEIMSKFDFALTIDHDLNMNKFSCIINASLDLFNVQTVNKIGQRFHSMLKELFNRTDVQIKKPIYELSLILPDERALMQSVNNTQVLFPTVSCIHHRFVYQVMEHPQKLAVELDDQSLTYAELLYFAQMLAIYVLKNGGISSGEVICQCVERSLSMVSYRIRKYLFASM
jgi:hypothetical protein